MASFGASSRRRLSEADPRLQKIFRDVIQHFDCAVLCGYRSELEQNAAVEMGRSKTKYPHSKHNVLPSRAVDVIPWPLDWGDRERMSLFAGYVLATARSHSIAIRWGGDWDMDTEVADNQFDDLVHFELI